MGKITNTIKRKTLRFLKSRTCDVAAVEILTGIVLYARTGNEATLLLSIGGIIQAYLRYITSNSMSDK